MLHFFKFNKEINIKNSNISPYRAYYDLYPYLTLNNIFKLRKINKN